MSYTGAYAVSNEWLGFGIEATDGTYVTPTIYIPHLSPSWDPKVSWLTDDAFRGSPVDTYDEVPGNRYDEIGFKTYLRANEAPFFFVAALGGSDSVTGSDAPYTHTVGLFNDPAYGSQPPSFTIVWFNGLHLVAWTGCRLTSLGITYAADGKIELAHKWCGNIGITLTTSTTAPTPLPSPTFATEPMIPGWNYAYKIATSPEINVMSGSIDIKRNTKPIFTGGQEGPFQIFAGRNAVGGKLTAVLTAADNTMHAGLVRDHLTLKVIFTTDASVSPSHSVEFEMAEVQYQNPSEKPSKEYVEVMSDWKAVGNTTDAVTGGWSQIKTVTLNAVSTSAYTKPS